MSTGPEKNNAGRQKRTKEDEFLLRRGCYALKDGEWNPPRRGDQVRGDCVATPIHGGVVEGGLDSRNWLGGGRHDAKKGKGGCIG